MSGIPTWRRLWARLVWPGVQAVRAARATSTIECRPDAFDAQLGIETAGIVPRGRHAVPWSSWRHATRYQPMDVAALDGLLDQLPIAFDRFTFVDIGSGKGRGVIVAARRPFRRVIGLEFVPELHALAQRNVSTAGDRVHTAIELVCADAASWTPPAEPIVALLYNPFREPVLGTVLERLASSHHDCWLLTDNVAMQPEHGFAPVVREGRRGIWRPRYDPSVSSARATQRATVTGS